MIVDCHTQIWSSETQWGRAAAAYHTEVQADEGRHLAASEPVDKAIVFGFKSGYLEAEIPNRYVADYVRRYPKKLVGFAGIDPTARDCLEDLRIAQDELNLKGVILSPALQNFHPADTRAMEVYAECARRGLPVLVDQSPRSPGARLEFAQPILLDEVAREFPELRLIVARLGHPWTEQTTLLLAKHANVFANIAGLLPHPWLTYTSLLAAHEHGVMGKLLFGSDFPFRSAAACIEALYSVNHFTQGSNLPSVPREELRGIVERDALRLLGIGPAAPVLRTPAKAIFSDDD